MPHERRADMARNAGTRGQTIEPGPFAHIIVGIHWVHAKDVLRVASSCASYCKDNTFGMFWVKPWKH